MDEVGARERSSRDLFLLLPGLLQDALRGPEVVVLGRVRQLFLHLRKQRLERVSVTRTPSNTPKSDQSTLKDTGTAKIGWPKV